MTVRDVFHLDRIVHPTGGPVAARGSAALLRRDRSHLNAAIIFVHGFGATPVTSWVGFPEAFEQVPALGSHDCYFFGYPSKSRQVGSLASLLASFLLRIGTDEIPNLILHELGASTPQTPTYARVIVAAHSMGAVVTRRALWLLRNDNRFPRDRFALRLFAPAHAGTRVSPALIAAAAGYPVVQTLLSAAAFLIPAAEDLDRAKSPYLQNLRAKTEELVAAGQGSFSADCVFGDDDRIVIHDHFDGDRLEMPDPAPHNHFSIVQVTSAWQYPVTFVCDGCQV